MKEKLLSETCIRLNCKYMTRKCKGGNAVEKGGFEIRAKDPKDFREKLLDYSTCMSSET